MIQCDIKSLYAHLRLAQKCCAESDKFDIGDLIDGWGIEEIETNFDIKPNDFLNFARQDLKANYEHHLINSLTNVKRAIDCQIDSIFIALGLNTKKSESEYWNFPEKIDLLNKLGIISPDILQNINQQRNNLEHKYAKPKENEIKIAIDTAQLFIKYTDKYLNAMPFSGMLREPKTKNSFLNVDLDYKNRILRFEGREYDDDFKILKNHYVKEISEANRDEYVKYLKWFLLITNIEFQW